MDNNAKELKRLYDLLNQEPVQEYSSLETEVDQIQPPSTLSTPSTVTDTDFPSPLLLFTPELDKSFSFDLQDILDLSTEEEKSELTGQNSFLSKDSSSQNSSSTESSETIEDSSFDPDSLLNKEKISSEEIITQKVLPPEETHTESIETPEEAQLIPKSVRKSSRKCSRKPRNPTPIPGRKDFKLLKAPQKRNRNPAQSLQHQPPTITHFVTVPQAPIVAYNPTFSHRAAPVPLLQIPVQPTPGFAPRYIKYTKPSF